MRGLAEQLVDACLDSVVVVSSIGETVVALLSVAPVPANHFTRQLIDAFASGFRRDAKQLVDACLDLVVVVPSCGEALVADIAVTPITTDHLTSQLINTLATGCGGLRRCWRGRCAGVIGHVVVPVLCARAI